MNYIHSRPADYVLFRIGGYVNNVSSQGPPPFAAPFFRKFCKETIMSKPTTSDYLKLVFQHVVQSDADDWKRLSKKKNDDGQWVREFENKDSGDRLTVTEMEKGYFNVKGKDLEANVRIPNAFLAAAQKPAAPKSTAQGAAGPVIETDPAKNAAADAVIRILMGEDPAADYDDPDADWGVPNKLVEEAGLALANRHCFAIMAEEGDIPYAMITPIRFFEQEGHCSDQSVPVHELMPKCGEAMESTWEIYEKGVDTPVEAARYLQSLGFQWDRGFQDFIDPSVTAELAAALETDATLEALKKYRENDPGFEQSIRDFADAEVKYGKDDPVEGKPVVKKPGAPKGPKT